MFHSFPVTFRNSSKLPWSSFSSLGIVLLLTRENILLSLDINYLVIFCNPCMQGGTQPPDFSQSFLSNVWCSSMTCFQLHMSSLVTGERTNQGGRGSMLQLFSLQGHLLWTSTKLPAARCSSTLLGLIQRCWVPWVNEELVICQSAALGIVVVDQRHPGHFTSVTSEVGRNLRVQAFLEPAGTHKCLQNKNKNTGRVCITEPQNAGVYLKLVLVAIFVI